VGKIKIDLRKQLRAIGTAIQDDNVQRLLSGETVSGGSVEARKTPEEHKKTRKRVRIHGARVKLEQLQEKPGVKSGDMLKDAQRRANVKVGRTTVKVGPSAEMRRRWFAFNAGTTHQPARSISGVSDSLLRSASEDLVREGRAQIVRKINEAKRASR
jgi:hypothetical protein